MEKIVLGLITSRRTLYAEIFVLGEFCSWRIFLEIKYSEVNYELVNFVPGDKPNWRIMFWDNYLLEKKFGRNESRRNFPGRKM